MESKSLLAKLKLWGIHAPSHMATLDERTVAIVRQKIKKGEEAPEAPKKPILIKKKSVSPVTEILEGQPSQEEAILSSELPPSEVRTSVASQEPKISETAPQLSESLPPPIPPVENILPRIPVEGWTQESMPSRQAEKGVPAATSATPSKEAAEKGSARDRGAVGDKRGKPAKSVKEKTQKLDRLHMLREEDFVDLEESAEKEKESVPGKTPAAPAGVHRVVAPGAPPETPAVPRAPFPRPAFKKPTSFKKKSKGGSDSRNASPAIDGTKARKKSIRIEAGTSVKDFADRMGVKVQDVIMRLMSMGVMATITEPIDPEAAMLVAEQLGIVVEIQQEEPEEAILGETEDSPEDLLSRPPVVTIMGHTDHGKTSLLDAIRKSKVAEGEAGGITQHIGAYTVSINGRDITFLDTPGHEAFTAMRARGAKATDVVVLVVAADDGVMPQTVEAINHARAADVPIVVAINKIDKPEANPDRVKQALSEYGLTPEEWGGTTIFCPVSAKKRIGLDLLLEMILLQADVLDLKANPNRRARGLVIESRLDRGRGIVASVLVQKGTLKVGNFLVLGAQVGRVRSLTDPFGHRVTEVTPSHSAEVIGLDGMPQPGDIFIAVEDEKLGRQVAMARQARQRAAQLLQNKKVTLEDLYTQIEEGIIKDLNLILKVDVQGSIEPIRQAIGKLENKKVRVRFIHEGVGGIRETDVLLAQASNAVILGFNVRPEPKALALAEREKVEMKFYSVIYDAVEDIRKAMEGMLSPTIREKFIGRAEVRQVYNITRVGMVAGCYVSEGVMQRTGTVIKLIRDGAVVYEGKMEALKRFKDDVREVAAGYECGISLENFRDIKVGDLIECFVQEKVAGKLEPVSP
ncbi:MAG: translation initiation factor IF-2 [Nitrospirae bacterium]|nr:translation initiation factor IF-2 [Nitrospirota bacterium]MCL5285573.1 translation initiation factor IF-2 [Nitrospirota bacterium]